MVEIYIMEFKLDDIKNWGLKFQRCKDKLVLKNMNMLLLFIHHIDFRVD